MVIGSASDAVLDALALTVLRVAAQASPSRCARPEPTDFHDNPPR